MNAIRSHQAPAAVSPRGGVDKPRGVENAALQHQRKQVGKVAASPAAVVSLGSHVEAVTYTREGRWAGTPSATSVPSARADAAPAGSSLPAESADAGAVSVGEGSSLHVNARAGSGSGGTLIVGDDSSVHINTRGSGGGGTLIVGDNSNVHINARGSGGGGTLIVGDDSNVHINARASGGGGTSVVADEAGLPPPQSAAVARPFSASAYLSQRSVATEHGAVADRNAVADQSAAAERSAAAAPHSPVKLEQDGRFSGTRATAPRAPGTAAPASLDPRLQMFNRLVDSVRQPAASKKSGPVKDLDDVKKAKGTQEAEDVKAKDAKAADDAKVKDAKEVDDVEADVSATEGVDEPTPQRHGRAASLPSRARA